MRAWPGERLAMIGKKGKEEGQFSFENGGKAKGTHRCDEQSQSWGCHRDD
jgi:hypothetical protein